MKKTVLLVFLFLLFILPCAFADDTDIFGVVKVNVKPNVMVILDNSASMRRIEGPVGNYDSSVQYMGVYDNSMFYYRLAPITEKIRPGIMNEGRMSNIVCTGLKNDLDTAGYSHSKFFKQADGKFHCEPQDTGRCASGYENDLSSIYKGNYLNWYFWGKYDDVYEKNTSYYGLFSNDQYYLDRNRELIDSITPEEIDFNEDAIDRIDSDELKNALENNGEWHSSVIPLKQLDRDNGRYKISSVSTLTAYSVYHGNYLNWFFYRKDAGGYDKTKNYSGCFDKRYFYYIEKTKDPVQKIKDDHDKGLKELSSSLVNCQLIKDDLNSAGMWSGAACIKDYFSEIKDVECGSDSILNDLMDTLNIRYHAYSGNYLNWYYERRLDLAKRVMRDYFTETRTDARLGLMTFNDFVEASAGFLEDGGHVNAEISDDINGFINKLKLVKPISRLHSPLAETLAEAGLYYAGLEGWYNDRTYTSPITNYCQSNNVIIISDGVTPFDLDHRLWRSPATGNHYICTWDDDSRNDYIGDYNNHADLTFLDDVAAYLYRNDIYQDSRFASPHPDEETRQNVRTHMIGFRIDGLIDVVTTNKGRMNYAAGVGGGIFAEASDAESLEVALTTAIESVMNNIESRSTFFVTPSVPVSATDASYSGDYVYLSMFYPLEQIRWIGNLKKYPVNSEMTLATEVWTGSTSDEVKDGGARAKLLEKKESERVILFNDGENIKPFNTANVTKEMTKGGEANWKDTDHNALIRNIRCGGVARDDGFLGEYALGDIIHFAPLLKRYGDDQSGVSRIFAGANDGMLHCFDENEGIEKWAFIPDDQIPRLKELIRPNIKPGVDGSLPRPFYIDGGRSLYKKDDGKTLLVFGERRGGKNYYALDVTSADSPKFAYSLKPGDSFGQSWSNPRIVPVIDENIKKHIFWIGGGYDAANQDKYDRNNPALKPAETDSVGKGIYAVNAENGQIIITPDNDGIDNCIIDPVSFSPGYSGNPASDGSGLSFSDREESHSRLYAPDMGGNLWGYRQDADNINVVEHISTHQAGERTGPWKKYHIFSSGAVQRKIFHRPEVVLDVFSKKKLDPATGESKFDRYNGEYVYFGTGDREHPAVKPASNDLLSQNRFYALKNCWDTETPASEADLMDVTAYPFDTSGLVTNRGWYIRMEKNGEKVVSYPVAYRGMVFFTTYTPAEDSDPAASESEDPCEGCNKLGKARLYILNYKTGEPVLNLSSRGLDAGNNETDNPAEIKKLCKSDRVVEIGEGMPGAPSLLFPKNGGSKIMVGVGDRIYTYELDVRDMTFYYWREKF